MRSCMTRTTLRRPSKSLGKLPCTFWGSSWIRVQWHTARLMDSSTPIRRWRSGSKSNLPEDHSYRTSLLQVAHYTFIAILEQLGLGPCKCLQQIVQMVLCERFRGVAAKVTGKECHVLVIGIDAAHDRLGGVELPS